MAQEPNAPTHADPVPRTLDPAYYRIHSVERIPTPSVCVYPDLISQNIDRAIQLVGGPQQLRPHVKTHKTAEIVRMLIDRGVHKHKCATLAEAKLLVDSGACDILVSYPIVGPNIDRFANLVCDHPDAAFSLIADHKVSIDALEARFASVKYPVEVLLDVDAGMGRTGVPIGSQILQLYKHIQQCRWLTPGGLHIYDGHNDQPVLHDRRTRVADIAKQLQPILQQIADAGIPVPRIVVGGSGSFHLWLKHADLLPGLEGSPGTFVFSDWNYHRRFPDSEMIPAAVALTRVISKPRTGRMTLDLGHKAVASDTLAHQRVWFFDLPDWEFVRQSEEHLVIDTTSADQFLPGDVLYALPYHVCPTIALHRDLWVIKDHEISGQWRVAARDRQ